MRLTEDPWVLQTIMGSKIEFSMLPSQDKPPRELVFNTEESVIMSREIGQLAAKEAITRSAERGRGFISSLFLVPKADVSWCPVVNLKLLNCFVVSAHFKMESARTSKSLIQPGDLLIKLNLRDASLAVSIYQPQQNF